MSPWSTPTFVPIPQPLVFRTSMPMEAPPLLPLIRVTGMGSPVNSAVITLGRSAAVNVGTDLFTFMFGPQLYFHHYRRFSPFAHELLGVAHSGNEFGITGSHNSFTMALGGGVDVPFWGHLSLRVGPIDYLLTQFPETRSSRDRKSVV